MGMKLKLKPNSEFLLAIVEGKFSLNEAKRAFVEILDATIEHKNTKIIIEGRRLKGSPTTMDRFHFGEFAAQMVSTYSTKGLFPAPTFAFVMKEPIFDPHKFGETVAANRGMNIRVFEEIDEALEWLGLSSGMDIDER